MAGVRTISATEARRLLLHGQGLLEDPARPASPAAVHRQIERMGFVQVDTINVVERAHHHIIGSRFHDYRPTVLTRLLEKDRKLFEHWTHDASVIPIAWFPYWQVRFERYRRRGIDAASWWAKRMEGDPVAVIDDVLERITREGPLMSKDFEHERKPGQGSWWGWKPQKAALEYLWRQGTLTVTRRVNFHKVYDLTERVLPHLHDGPMPDQSQHVDWACETALDRLGVATPSELARFMNAIDLPAARAWCQSAAERGAVEQVQVESADDSPPQVAFAVPDWKERVECLPGPPPGMRLLSPFDPILRDRDRTERRFGFRYRFEAFVPEAKREYGYYVLPLLEGERLVGRVDPKHHRQEGELEIKGVWWEPKFKPTRQRRQALEEAVNDLACSIGAEYWRI